MIDRYQLPHIKSLVATIDYYFIAFLTIRRSLLSYSSVIFQRKCRKKKNIFQKNFEWNKGLSSLSWFGSMLPCFGCLFQMTFPDECFGLLLQMTIDVCFRWLFRFTVPDNYFGCLFRMTFLDACSELLFRMPISDDFSRWLFRITVPDEYFRCLFVIPRLLFCKTTGRK